MPTNKKAIYPDIAIVCGVNFFILGSYSINVPENKKYINKIITGMANA